jgi:hypothetical protein
VSGAVPCHGGGRLRYDWGLFDIVPPGGGPCDTCAACLCDLAATYVFDQELAAITNDILMTSLAEPPEPPKLGW